MNYTEMLFNRDEKLVNLLNQADSKNLELIEEINEKEDEIERLNNIINEVREYIDFMYKQFEKIEDKELITNRVIDISVLEKILEILDKGE